jgi:hypothetical protein
VWRHGALRSLWCWRAMPRERLVRVDGTGGVGECLSSSPVRVWRGLRARDFVRSGMIGRWRCAGSSEFSTAAAGSTPEMEGTYLVLSALGGKISLSGLVFLCSYIKNHFKKFIKKLIKNMS